MDMVALVLVGDRIKTSLHLAYFLFSIPKVPLSSPKDVTDQQFLS